MLSPNPHLYLPNFFFFAPLLAAAAAAAAAIIVTVPSPSPSLSLSPSAMAKRSKINGQRKFAGKRSAKVQTKDSHVFREEDIDDEIDAFHKQRDVVPLDADEDSGDSDDEMDQAVFDLEGGEDSDSSKSNEENDNDSEEFQLKGFAAKMARQEKYLKQKFGGVDEMNDDDTEEEEEKKAMWGRKKNLYYSGDNIHEHESSDEDLLKEEEAEVVKIQREKAKSLSMEDFGLEDAEIISSDSVWQEEAFQDVFAGKRTVPKHNIDAVLEDGPFDNYEVKKDLNALSKEEQKEVVNSSAPELVGLLTELDKALNQLKQVKPLLSEVVKEKKDTTKGARNYFGVKQTLLLSYCQAIAFYLLLKSEGHAIRDHPVIARLVEIKNLLEKMERIDLNLDLPPDIEETTNLQTDDSAKLAQQSVPMDFEPNMVYASAKPSETTDVNGASKMIKDSLSKDPVSKNVSTNLQVGSQSIEMLKVRASLEEKFKKKGIYNHSKINPERTQNHVAKPANKRLETLDDFDDEVHLTSKRHRESKHLSKPSMLVATKVKQPKVVSGDDDLPNRDDVGERRRKFELRVLARAGAETMSNDITAPQEDGEALESEDELYKQVKKQRTAKLMAKAQLYSRTPAAPNQPLEIEEEDGKRQITYQMEKNRGLTRSRKKETKNPRKKYKLKHKKAIIRRKGQVRDIKKPAGPYGGESSGININVSRSIRFKS